MKATAAVLNEPVSSDEFTESQPATIESIDVPDPVGEEVRVKVTAASLCHTDISIALGDLEESYPLVMGHEGAGVVSDVGNKVETVEPGDHVVLGRIACGHCRFCRLGRSNLCEERTASRRAGRLRTGEVRFRRNDSPIHHCHGVSSFSEYTIVTEEVAIPITEDVPLSEATLLGCGVFTGVGAVTTTADVEAASSVVIVGTGGVGLSAVQGARLRGADPIIAVDLLSEKLEIAASLGATHTIDASDGDPVKQVREILPGGADYAFDIVGIPPTIQQCVEMLGPLGTSVVVGTPSSGTKSVDLDMLDIVLGEKEIVGSFNGSRSLQLAIPELANLVVAGSLDLEPLVSGTYQLSDLNEAMYDLEHGSSRRQIIYPS